MPVNVLADRHHGGLWRSMQLLAERLGWTLWTPLGRDWQTEGYWQFGKNQPGLSDALAGQFLEPHDGVWTQQWDHEETWRSYDPEFPNVPIFGVSLAQALQSDWDYIVATVEDNQHGFKRFADEVGATYVLQVGNTNQYVDWSLDPLALVTSEVPILGRGVRYHQEMEPVATTFAPPDMADYWGARWRIASLVNCYGRSECGWTMPALQAELPEYGFETYGIDGAILKPIARVAAAMAGVGWGFHDKVQGDGFGHVIHGWAAIGRPLIGHGHHYHGKMAAPFWVDGVTCIDLDKHTMPEAAALISDISADPERHAAMCYAIRAVYDELVDHEAEAEAIRALLSSDQGG